MIGEDDLVEIRGLAPERCFFVIEQIVRRRVADAARAAGPNEWPEHDVFDYMVSVLAAAQEYGIDDLARWELPNRGDENANAICNNFRDEAGRVSQRLLLRHGLKKTTVALDPATKAKISLWLQNMRETVQDADITSEKKDRLLTLINQLQAEVDRDRTPVQAVGELFVTACAYIAVGAKKLDGMVRQIERVGSALGLARETEASAPQLPKPSSPKQISPPKQSGRTFDDEIPF